MEQAPEELYNEEISLKEVILKLSEWYKYLLLKWKVILLAGIIGGVSGFLYAWSKKPVYTSECTFVLEDSGSGAALGQYAGIASMVGIDLGGSGGNGIFQGDNIIELYKSRTMIEKTLLTFSDVGGREELLIDSYIRINKLRDSWNKEELKKLKFNRNKHDFTKLHDSIITVVVKDINKHYLTVEKPDKKLSIIAVKVNSTNEEFSKAFTDKIVENVNQFYIQTKIKKSIENISILQRQADSVRTILNASITGVASSIDANPNANPALQILRAPSQRKQIDIQANSSMYAEVVKNLEISKIAMRKETPLIQIIDRPIIPLDKNTTNKITAIIIGGSVVSLLVIISLLLSKLVRDIIA